MKQIRIGKTVKRHVEDKENTERCLRYFVGYEGCLGDYSKKDLSLEK